MVCVQCGAEFDAANSGLDSPARIWRGRPRQYCSDACRMRAYRSRRTRQDAPERVDPDREVARTARLLAAELNTAAGAVRAAVPGDRASRATREEGLRRAAADARRVAALAATLADLLESRPGAAESDEGVGAGPG
ncbi:hypothetical protein [Yinghuangia sp. YIM S09857]|uniref:hypothetical protein n=1 Tax=Yinghuangia sp. YIM S09857 TaxID=3436929 RepID=UPI003F53BC30